MLSLPNILSIARILSVPLIVWLILERAYQPAFWLFVAAGLSDAADGFIAKHFDARTEIGAYLDPLADKALLVGIYVTLGVSGCIETWLVILVVFRDILIIGGALLYQTLNHDLTMRPLMVSKVNTVAQITLAALVLGLKGFGLDDGLALAVLVPLVAATTLVSGTAYVYTWTRRAMMMERGE
ncbi:MAG: CDP-alcohol phosphatidyltransferase family protein [Rhodobacterales bacterium]|nr:CDP-alcohol phosphatidyltransferase family protein [Rhodobacterales bacterium]